MKYIKLLPVLLIAILAFTLFAVSAPAARAEAASLTGEEIIITLSDSGSVCSDSSVLIDGSTVTITAAGDYVLTGSLSDGQLLIDAPDDAKVKLILNGVTLVKNGHAAIYAVSADKLVVSTLEGSENLVQSTGEFVQTDENTVDAAIFAKCDLTLTGDGILNVSCLSGHAVVSKDDLKLKSGTVNLEAASKGLSGKDSVTIEGGTLNADVGTDAVYAGDGENTEKGGITITDGTLNLLSQKEGLDATGAITIEGGSLVINAGSGQEGKGIKSDSAITICGGSLNVIAVDDAIHSDSTVTIDGGELTLQSSDDGIHADEALTVNAGVIHVTQSYEGLEAEVVTINGGEITIRSSDDGINAAGGNDGSNSFGPFGGDSFSPFGGGMGGNDANAQLIINGGTLVVNADGDGLDSNGYLNVTGGTVYVSGPTNNGNGALDSGLEASISGGTVIAAGAAGMAENFGQNSTQGSILLNLSSTQAAGTTVSVTDASGTVLASFQPEKSYSSVVISTAGLVQGGTYTVTAGTEIQTVTLDSLIYGSGMGMGMMGGPGMGHGGFGGMQDGFDGGFAPGQSMTDGTQPPAMPDGSQPGSFGGPGMGHGGFGGPGRH